MLNQFMASMDNDGRIMTSNFQGGTQHIGWTCAKYDELSKLLEEALAKAVHHLEPDDGEEDSSVEAKALADAEEEHTAPAWAKGYPVIWDRFHTLKHAFCDFMTQKYAEGDGSALLANVFTAHWALVNAILSMTNVTEQEKAVVASAVKR